MDITLNIDVWMDEDGLLYIEDTEGCKHYPAGAVVPHPHTGLVVRRLRGIEKLY